MPLLPLLSLSMLLELSTQLGWDRQNLHIGEHLFCCFTCNLYSLFISFLKFLISQCICDSRSPLANILQTKDMTELCSLLVVVSSEATQTLSGIDNFFSVFCIDLLFRISCEFIAKNCIISLLD